MSKQFVQIDKKTMTQLEKVAKQNGYPSVEKLLNDFAFKFSTECSVTEKKTRKVA